jgi:hypothetical protein
MSKIDRLDHGVAQLRHLYIQMIENRVDAPAAARRLLGPAIAEIELASAAERRQLDRAGRVIENLLAQGDAALQRAQAAAARIADLDRKLGAATRVGGGVASPEAYERARAELAAVERERDRAAARSGHAASAANPAPALDDELRAHELLEATCLVSQVIQLLDGREMPPAVRAAYETAAAAAHALYQTAGEARFGAEGTTVANDEVSPARTYDVRSLGGGQVRRVQ